ncbi:hypothetical protein AC249_AIPGENE7328 [Exaiptasia diaphana]|nr:hypothetical protein AC249_AIPGENE7328 [Exaiptasia diaphana]
MNYILESPIRAAEGFGSYLCVQPKSGDCNPIENQTTWTHGLVWKLADKNCSAEHMKFLFDVDGKIYHKCSGKIVCPQEDGDDLNNQRLILNDTCPDDIARHKRLPSHSLQHVKSGICVHSSYGTPKVGRFLIYHKSGCDLERFMLIFFKLSNP